jgi:hypothetical protein
VNANPSGSRTPPAGGRGLSIARRESEGTTGPSPDLVQIVGRAVDRDAAGRQSRGSIGGMRHAKMVCRGGLRARRAARGRVGNRCPRHVVRHLAPHPLLSANTSALADVVRPLRTGGARSWSWLSAESTVHLRSSRLEAQPTDRSVPRPEARDTELVPPEHDVVATPSRGHFRGKGVLAV